MNLRQCCKPHTALVDSYNTTPSISTPVSTNNTISHNTVSPYAAPPLPLPPSPPPPGPCTDSCTTPTSCQDVYNRGCRQSGVYTIDPGCGKAFDVWCDLHGGGIWTIFQRRMDGSVSFNRSWDSYVEGFGKLHQEHWLGPEKIHCLQGKGRALCWHVRLLRSEEVREVQLLPCGGEQCQLQATHQWLLRDSWGQLYYRRAQWKAVHHMGSWQWPTIIWQLCSTRWEWMVV